MAGQGELITAVTTAEIPAALGPYSQAVRMGNLLFTSGLFGTRAATGDLAGADVQAQSEQALVNLERLLAAAGSSLTQVVKVTVYLADLRDFSEFNAVYARHFAAPFPARSCVQVAALPKNARLELDAIAVLE